MATIPTQKKQSKMERTSSLGADFWNDSCALGELGEAVANGAVGATSNPVIVTAAVKGESERWTPVLDKLIKDHPQADEDEIAWKLIEAIGVEAAALLRPVYDATKGQKGFLSMQVSPKLYRDSGRMLEHGKKLALLAPNIAIKLPATEAGLAAMEEVTAAGINVNATVSFSVSQAVAAAEACERGFKRAKDTSKLHPYTTIMIGRVDDQLKRVAESDSIEIDAEKIAWAGIAVFKRAHKIFLEKGYQSTLLAAAYRHEGHWSELIGERVVLTIPYKWWKKFEDSSVEPAETLSRPVDPAIVAALEKAFPDFRRAYEPDGMKVGEFASFGPSVATLRQFLSGYAQLLELVRDRMVV